MSQDGGQSDGGQGGQQGAAGQDGGQQGSQGAAGQDGGQQGQQGQGAAPAYDAAAIDAYEFKVGKDASAPDAELVTELRTYAKDNKLGPEAAQKAFDLGQRAIAKAGEALNKQVAEAHKAWGAAAKADTEIGGEKFDANLAIAKQGFEKFGSPELAKLLNETGLGNHPEVLRLGFRLGKLVQQDTSGTGGARGAAGAQSFYGKSGMNP